MYKHYQKFLASKAVRAKERGLTAIPDLAPHLFPFQRLSVEFALRVGAAGLFHDTGLGKTECQLEFCQRAIEATNSKALILTPLAVAGQTARRAARWGYEARVIREQSEARSGINICNYDRLDKLDPSEFGVVCLDEASILKSFVGKTTRALIDTFRGHRFKLTATATPAPNDHMEFGNYAEFLEVMAANEMLSRFFINDTSTASQEWRLKGHAVNAFWDWMASFSRMAERPSDITGNLADDTAFLLPAFEVIRHRARDSRIDTELSDLFGGPALSATNMYDIKRQTTKERAKVACEIINSGISEWLNSQRNQENKRTELTPCDALVTLPVADIENSQDVHTNSVRRPPSRPQTSNSDMLSESSGKTTPPCSIVKTDDAQSVERVNRAGTENSTLITATKPDAFAGCSAIAATSASAFSGMTPRTFDALPTISKGERIPAWVLWCDTNEEQSTLENELGDLCISIRGDLSADEKEARHTAWLNGVRPVLLTKPSIFGFGVDWQHCANMIFVGRTFSYETWYQAVRRCWRFGQTRAVQVHLVVAEGETEIGRVIDRKADDHISMKTAMRAAMRRAVDGSTATKTPYLPNHKTRLPSWL